MNNILIKKCPYCGKKLSYFKVLFNLRSGEYTCKECGKYSNVEYYKLFAYMFLLVIICLSIVFGFVLFKDSLEGVVLCSLPFVIYYFSLPLFFKLTAVKFKKKNSAFDSSSKFTNYGENSHKKQENVREYVPKLKKYRNKSNYELKDDGDTMYLPDIDQLRRR